MKPPQNQLRQSFFGVMYGDVFSPFLSDFFSPPDFLEHDIKYMNWN